jgi:hypothetical protein
MVQGGAGLVVGRTRARILGGAVVNCPNRKKIQDNVPGTPPGQVFRTTRDCATYK